MVKIDVEKCIGCGTCVAMCPQCFQMNSHGKAESKCSGKDCDCGCDLEGVISACPTGAITK